jgi:hypothetical protein
MHREAAGVPAVKRNLSRVDRRKDDSDVAEHVFEGVRTRRRESAKNAGAARAGAATARERAPAARKPSKS